MYNNEEYLRKKNMVGKSAEDKDEVMNLINKLDTRAKAISIVNLITANRPSEMLLLKISDFDLDNKSVTVMMKKQKEMKIKRLTLEAVHLVKASIREYDLKENDLFVGKVDKWDNYSSVAISDSAYRKTIHKWLGFAPYTLRKTQITAMHEAGADIATIAKQSGHKSLETITKHYLEVNDTTVDKYL
ncbi:tyrosine-type recombinase/integrase [Psychrobacillus sp. OK028]|uniref:tyrosine-type recombinase/integrase n=1 Tax=Psychrobacillus sp. OK028 TaxID=1884359 RepID=UPI000B804AAD|nr:tyrosine-type recombinase/integrase [Psychrobacillus sp. OK028]